MTRIPRTYYAKRLLEHGELTGKEFCEITGWHRKAAWRTLFQLVATGIAVRGVRWDRRTYVYRLA